MSINAKPILQTIALTHTYSQGTPFQRDALRGVDFNAYEGEFLGIIGCTGSGKSTLLQHLNGLLKPTSGQVLFQGQDIWAGSKPLARQLCFQVGLVFQYPEHQLFEETVLKDISFGPKNMGLDADEVLRRAEWAADFTGLPRETLSRSPFDLSGGQKRRAAIAGVIAMEPRVLILDEPTAGLDPAGRRSLLENIKKYQQAQRATVIFVSHSMEEVAQYAQRIVVLLDGRATLEGTPTEIFSHGTLLRQQGLDIPPITQIVNRLRELGIPLSPAIHTPEEAAAALCALRGGAEK